MAKVVHPVSVILTVFLRYFPIMTTVNPLFKIHFRSIYYYPQIGPSPFLQRSQPSLVKSPAWGLKSDRELEKLSTKSTKTSTRTKKPHLSGLQKCKQKLRNLITKFTKISINHLKNLPQTEIFISFVHL